jgi:HAD superfamily hydrolase (TIGR01458 family)
MAASLTVRGVLIDVDGVLHVDGTPIPGAAQALRDLRAAGLGVRLLTNNTMRTRAALAAYLGGMGIDVKPGQILSAIAATAEYLRHTHPGEPVHLLVSGDVAVEFEGIPLTDGEDEARVVVFGGAGETFTFAALNRAYRMLRNGAALVVMHKNLHWLTAAGITLDAGPYIHGLEWAAGVEAVVVGKPARHFFEAGFAALGLRPDEVAMVGDDVRHDVHAAQQLGAHGILVRTGVGSINRSDGVSPDLVIDSIADLPARLAGRR